MFTEILMVSGGGLTALRRSRILLSLTRIYFPRLLHTCSLGQDLFYSPLAAPRSAPSLSLWQRWLLSTVLMSIARSIGVVPWDYLTVRPYWLYHSSSNVLLDWSIFKSDRFISIFTNSNFYFSFYMLLSNTFLTALV